MTALIDQETPVEHPASSELAAPSTAVRTVLFAGGGSGGHISPGLAIAERLLERAPSVRTVFACSVRPVDALMLEDAGADHRPIPAAPFSTRPRGMFAFLRGFAAGRAAADRLIDEVGPDRVVALGGFVAAPVVAAARRRGVPVMLVNLDAVPGRANRWMARSATDVLSAVETPGQSRFSSRVREVVGMPIRRSTQAPGDPATCRTELGLDPERRTLLVTGASQGSVSLNRLVTTMATRRPEAFAEWQVLHLAGRGDDDVVRTAYAAAGVPARVLPFLHRMGLAWGTADLALSRAGANSVAEAVANAVPTLFLPYPYHRDLHQRLNAEPFESIGGAEITLDHVETEANVADAGAALFALMAEHDRRASMRSALAAHRPEDAAGRIADLILNGPRRAGRD